MSSEKVTQARVGVFVLIGLVAICAMVVYFGRFGDGLKEFYDLRVEFRNASGLFPGADVLLAGAKIGSVKDGPYVLKDMRGVYVMVKIEEGVRIPANSAFSVGSSGLLGDAFVNINMPAELDVENFVALEPGATVVGKKESGGLSELAGEGGKLLDEVRATVKNVDTVVTRLNAEVLSEKSVKAIEETVANLKETSDGFAKASKDLDKVMADASTAMEQATTTMKSFSTTVEKTNATLDSTKEAAEAFDRAMADVSALVREAKSGKGPLGTLISDRTMADNLRALVVNLRKHGILWYRDRSGLRKDDGN